MHRSLASAALRTACLCGIALLLMSCREAPPPAPPPRDASITLESPVAAARTLLVKLRELLAASADKRRDDAAAVRTRIAFHVIDRDGLLRFYRTIDRRPHKPDEVLGNLVDSWASAVAYYADGLAFERAWHRTDAGGTDAFVPAEHAESRAVVRVSLVRPVGVNEWRATRLELLPAESVEAATQPAPSEPAVEGAPPG